MSSVYAPETSPRVNSSDSASRLNTGQPINEVLTQDTSAKRRPGRPFLRRLVLNRLSKLTSGQLTIHDPLGEHRCGLEHGLQNSASLQVHRLKFYRQVALGGGLGAAEAYIRGDWDAANLTEVMRVLARNMDVLAGVERGGARLLRPWRVAAHWLRRNSRHGSRRNISAHYDLSNDFFALMLDPTMTYSSGIFKSPESNLTAAALEKYDRICRKLQLSASDHVLEIGTGWGGFAEYAARNYGCRLTTTTISDHQHAYAANRFRQAGLNEQITLLKQDYRDLRGEFTKLVSVEMIEAVGESFLPEFFAQCARLLRPDGAMCLQAILIPDQRYQRYRHSVDFIQRYIFHGGFLPSLGAITQCVARRTNFRCVHLEDFGQHYAATLKLWRENFLANLPAVQALGFDERFIRTWHYYLCYCEAGFREQQIGVSQLLFTKPGSRINADF